jgi:YHS domain-containing protein
MIGRRAAKESAVCCGGEAVHLGHKVRDPLCGMSVDANSPYQLEGNDGLRFCSEDCRDDYARAVAGAGVPGVAFTCDMHPAGPQEGPGECALCGSQLMPMRVGPRRGSSSRLGSGLQRLQATLRL